jgi:hypothetical protein
MILRISLATVCLLLCATTANGQCSGCSQNSPVFSQGMSAPVYSSVGYAQPMVQGYAVQPMTYTSAPAQSGCGCGQSSVPQMTYTSAPVQSGCVGCGQSSAPQMTYTAAPVQSGCGDCGQATQTSAPACGCESACGSSGNCDSCCDSNGSSRRRLFGNRSARRMGATTY